MSEEDSQQKTLPFALKINEVLLNQMSDVRLGSTTGWTKASYDLGWLNMYLTNQRLLFCTQGVSFWSVLLGKKETGNIALEIDLRNATDVSLNPPGPLTRGWMAQSVMKNIHVSVRNQDKIEDLQITLRGLNIDAKIDEWIAGIKDAAGK